MPLISSFYGVLVYLYWLDTRQHHLPHIHAVYAGDEAVFSIETGELLDGSLPRRQTRLVQAWIEIRCDELLAEGSLAVKGQPVFPIDPLKWGPARHEPTCGRRHPARTPSVAADADQRRAAPPGCDTLPGLPGLRAAA